MATECCSCGLVFSVNRQREVLNCGHQPCRPCLEANSRGSEKRCPTCSKKCCQTQNEGAVVTVQGHATVRLVRLAAADVAATHDAVSEELQHASNSLAALRSWAVAAAERQDLAALCAHAACAERVRGVLQEALALVHEEARRCLGQDHGDATSQRPCTDQERPQHASDQCVGAELKLEMECEEVDEMTKHQDAGGLKLSETLSMEGQPTVGADNVSNPETAIQEQPSSPEVKVEPCDTQDAVEQHSGNDVSDLPEVVQEAVVQRSAENSALKAESSLLESLPAELLHAVLDYVPTEELPSLRLLSRRWSALVLDESLWRSRRLTVHADQDSAAVLRVAPALAELALEMSYPPLRGVEALRALADGACQVHTFKLNFWASTVSNKLITRVLRSPCNTVRELYIKVTGCSSVSNVVTVLEAIDALAELEILELSFGSACPNFTFRRLRLQGLLLLESGPISDRTRRSLISLGKHTLRKVLLHSCLPVRRELAQCTRLDTLIVEHCHGLREVVPQLASLQHLVVVFGPSLAPWLQWAHDEKLSLNTVVFVELKNADDLQHFVDSADTLLDVGAVTIYSSSSAEPVTVPPALVTSCLQSLPTLETLKLDVDTDYLEVLRCWSESTAPRLLALTIKERDPACRRALLQGFETVRPSLKLQFF